jgi:RNA polymerase sigma factor (sigma-70 family)
MNIFDQHRYLLETIDEDLQEVERLKRLAKSIPTADPSKEFVGRGFISGARYTELVDKAIDMETTILDMTNEKLDFEREIYALLRQLDRIDPQGALVLRKFYIKNITVKDIAIQLDLSERRVHDIKSRAIRKCEELRTGSLPSVI